MFSSVYSASITGIESHMVSVEADVSNGLPGMMMVGFLSSEVREAQERVRSAIRNSGIYLQPKKITVNLSPADLRKGGSGFDLPIAVALLAAYGYLPEVYVKDRFFAGELGLDGHVNSVRGILGMVQEAQCCGIRECFVPEPNAREAAVVSGMEIYGVRTISELLDHLLQEHPIPRTNINIEEIMQTPQQLASEDFSDVRGQKLIRRAAELAAAGRHNLMISGPPGAGKSMIARRIATILPQMSMEESLEVSRIHSIAGTLPPEGIVRKRPFRMPHHTITAIGLAGGGVIPCPGEISLSHRGILYLDEIPEFNSNVLEILRQPLEDRKITITRNSGTYQFPADFILVASRNNCKCGFWPDRTRCRCKESDIRRYLHRISRPLLDRIDIHISAEPIRYEELTDLEPGESSKSIRERVERVRKIQEERYRGTSIRFNGELTADQINRYCPLDEEEKMFMQRVYEQKELTARTYHKLLKVARTIADLDGEERIGMPHLAEAVSYRPDEMLY